MHHQPILQFGTRHPTSIEIRHDSLDAVALLDALIGDARDDVHTLYNVCCGLRVRNS